MKSSEDQGGNLLEKGFKFGRNAVLASGAAMVFGLAVLVLSILAAVNPLDVFPHQDATSGGVLVEKVEYYLPYPGLLPDSPLYKLKALRDKIGLLLTWDEEQTAERELFLADKRINAAVALFEGGKEELAVTTATKAEKYLEAAINRAMTLKNSGKDVKSMLGVMAKAAAKHEELMERFAKEVVAGKGLAVATLQMTSGLHERVDQVVRE